MNILLVGAKSDIAKACARFFANKGYSLFLAARNVQELESFATDIRVRTQQSVALLEFDAVDYSSHDVFFASLPEPMDCVLVAVGYLADQKKTESDWSKAENTIAVNYVGCVSLLNTVAREMEKRGSGSIIGISSVAGDRGRASNYIYGSAKAGFTVYLSGLRNRLTKKGVHVLTVKPGFVNTSMTENMDLPPYLTASPDDVARDIWNAVRKKRNVLYTKWFWKYIMFFIKCIPESLFKRLHL